MPQGRHRVEPVRRPLPRLPRPAQRQVAAGISAALLGLAAAGTIWPHAGAGPSAQAVSAAGNGATADALRSTVALRAEERASRDKRSSPRQAAPLEPTFDDAGPKTIPTVPAVVGRLWVTTDVNIRSGPSTGDDRIGSLEGGSRVKVTGVSTRGWTQVVTGGRAGWVKSTYLARSKPKPKPKPPAKRTPSGVSNAPCSVSPDIEQHLTANARAAYRAVCAEFGDTVRSFGGYRAGDGGDHGSGRAVDIMVSGEPGWDIARYLQRHARRLGVTYVIYEQKIWQAGNPTSEWKVMPDRGSATANHYDHVHVSVS